MGLTLIKAAKYENRLEHQAAIETFSEGEPLTRLPFTELPRSGRHRRTIPLAPPPRPPPPWW